MPKSKTTEQFIIDAYCKHGDKYNYKLIEYKNNKIKVKIICHKHGIFDQRPNAHLRGQGCKKCVIDSQRMHIDEFIKKSKLVHGEKYDYSLVKYKNWKSKIKIICPEHGVFEQQRNNHLRGDGCPKCSGVFKPNTNEYISSAIEVHNGKYEYNLVEYKKSHTKIKIICPIHGVFEQLATNHIQGQGCPKCASHISKAELELQEWLKRYIDIETNNRSLISPYELDIIIPSHKIAIEYNGLYWHGEQQGKGSKYHLNKYLACKEKGYRLIQIWENEWLFKQDIVKSILINALGKTPYKIHGRKCRIVEISPSVARPFYNDNHIQGFNGGRHIGLRYEDELVSLMTIRKDGELCRFVNKKYHNVYGAFSKLLKAFINEGYSSIYTFADLRWFTGNVYSMNGFEYVYTIKPGYTYFKDMIIYHRRHFQKKQIEHKYNKGELSYFNPDETEYINMLANGYDRIWDCGKIKFEYQH